MVTAEKYQAYSMATRTVAKTRQVVMLYDGAIRFLKQAGEAISVANIEERYRLLVKTTEVITGLQSSIDFENGGDIAGILHGFYSNMSMRILSLNFVKEKDVAKQECDDLIGELKQMRDVWEHIDLQIGKKDAVFDTNLYSGQISADGGNNILA